MGGKVFTNFWLDAALFVTTLGLAVSGFIRWLVLGSGGYGYRGGRGLRAQAEAGFIFDRHTWSDIHHWLAVTFLCLLAVHLALHWRLIVGTIRGRR